MRGRGGLWDLPSDAPGAEGLRADCREVLVSSVVDAVPDHRAEQPDPSLWPFLVGLGIGLLFITAIFTPWAVTWGSLAVFVTMVGWAWPRRKEAGVPA